MVSGSDGQPRKDGQPQAGDKDAEELIKNALGMIIEALGNDLRLSDIIGAVEHSKTQTIDDIFTLRLFGQSITGVGIDPGTFSTNFRPRDSDFANGTGPSSPDDRRPCLARVYGYLYNGKEVKLPKPVLLIVPDQGKDALNSRNFPRSQYLKWDVAPDDRTLRCDLLAGSVEDLLIGVPDMDEAPPSGATLIRGADGKMYCIPEDLENFEVVNETDKSELLMSETQARPDLSVVKMSARSAYQSRAALNLRSAFQARSGFARMANRATRHLLRG
jgi:hypothetical protein